MRGCAGTCPPVRVCAGGCAARVGPGTVLATTMTRRTIYSLGLLAALAAGCGGSKNTSDSESNGSSSGTTGSSSSATDTPTSSSSSSEGSTTDIPTTSGSSSTTGNDTAANGEPCVTNDDCMSLACLKFRDFEPDATCVEGPGGGNTRFTGTVLDFSTGMPFAGAELRVVGALTAIGDPQGAPGLVTATSDASGQIDATSTMPISQGLGLVGLISGTGLYVTATGLAAPFDGTTMYGPLNGIHDIWGVPEASLTTWSGFLSMDPDPMVAAAVPLGDNGGVIGLVRDFASSAPLAGAVVKPEGMGSKALVRYLNTDGMGFGPDMTGDSGIFVILNPGLAEKFTVEVGGMPTGLSGTAGSAKNAAFVLIFNVQ